MDIGSPNLKRPNSYVLQHRGSPSFEPKHDIDVNDGEDVVFSSSAIRQYSCFRKDYFGNIRSISFYLNEFGHKGGFWRSF